MVKKLRINENEMIDNKPKIKLKYDEIRSVMDVFRDVRNALKKQGYDTEKLASDFLFYKPKTVDDAYDFIERYVDIDYI